MSDFVPVDEAQMPVMLQPYEVVGCAHEWDEGAGSTSPNNNGMVEILDVCVNCGETRRTGQWDSIL